MHDLVQLIFSLPEKKNKNHIILPNKNVTEHQQ